MKYLLIFSLFLTTTAQGFDRITGLPFASRSEVIGQHGMVATSHPLATQAAIDILKDGGNAIDAAIAANALLGLVEPTGCGVGGDLFAIIWDAKTKQLYGLNASGPSPRNSSIEFMKSKGITQIPRYGPHPVTVPGAVAGWSAMHKKFGKKEFHSLFESAIYYAVNGFPVTELIAYYLEGSVENFHTFPNFKSVWMPNGKIPGKGDIFRNPHLANTYQSIANSYGESFYKGEIAEEIVKSLKKQGGAMQMSDLINYAPEWVEPVSTNYRGFDVWELPPNGQGIAALQILNILENFDISSMNLDSTEYIHLFTEAKKLAFEDRAKFYADPEFAEIPLERLISKQYARERSKLINFEQAADSFEAGNLENGDTIYLTVADKDGNMVSLIQSNYWGMGSGMVPNNVGFMLHDRGMMFSLDPEHNNSLIGGKRPFHTIIPAFVTHDGDPFISFGVMGGAMQPQGHAQIIINLIDFGMNLQEAGDAPRIRHSGSSQPTGEIMTKGGYLSLESGFSQKTRNGLETLGHKIHDEIGGFGGYQAIMQKNGLYFGASESRKDGQASGY